MSGSSWLIDGKRIATKIKTASKSFDPRNFNWKSNPTRACPNCSLIIDNSDVIDEWPGLPKGVKFDPSDQELLWHLLAKIGEGDTKPHPFINEFILTVDKEDGICYTHPQDLPGVKQDGTVTHFFHRTVKAYNTGTRKRRKIQKENDLDMRWHKTGKTKPIILDGVHRGCKKIMVLYMGMTKGEKSEKTNWVMHQYHASPGEDEKEGEFVISKIFYQQLHPKLVEKKDLSLSPEVMNPMAMDHPLTPQPVIDKKDHDYVHECDGAFATAKLGPVTPKSVSPNSSLDGSKHTNSFADEQPMPVNEEHASQAKVCHSVAVEEDVHLQGQELPEENHSFSDLKWFDIDSQILLDSQQLAEGLALCDDILQSQTSCGPDDRGKAPRLSDYAQIGSEHLKRDLEECQKLVMSFDHTDIEIDASSEFRLSQLDFGSQIE